MVSSEVMRFNGKCYRRYPESKQRDHRVYFRTNGFEGTPEFLHRAIYESVHGPIPEGYHVHHIDGNPLNNEISNLEAVPGSVHQSNHSKERLEDPEVAKRNLEHFKKINPMAVEWHKSEEGRAWHSENAKKCWKMHVPEKKSCENCGATFEDHSQEKNGRFCSNKCKTASRRKSGIDDEERTCIICGHKFNANRYSIKKACSSKCELSLRRLNKASKL